MSRTTPPDQIENTWTSSVLAKIRNSLAETGLYMSASVLTGGERRLLPLISVCVSDGSRERITGEELGEGHRGETAHGWWAGCCRERWDCVEEVTLQHTAEWQCWAGCHIRRLPYCHKQEVAWLTWWRNTHTARAHTHTHTHTHTRFLYIYIHLQNVQMWYHVCFSVEMKMLLYENRLTYYRYLIHYYRYSIHTFTFYHMCFPVFFHIV